MSAHKFVHVELSSENLETMKEFYGGAFGWTFMDFPEMNYTTFAAQDGALGGGFNPISDEFPAGTILLYIHTDDLADSREKVTAAGGSILMESFEIPGVGTMAIFRDPSGNQLALLEPAEGMSD